MRPYYPGHGIVQCPGCSLVFFDGAVDAAALYSPAYFQGEEYLDYLSDKAILQRNFASRVADLAALKPAGRLFEVGSAYGFFLELAARHWQVRGVDITPDGVRHAREVLGLDATESDFLALPDEPAAYDLICLWDTIEHLEHPMRYLERAARWLKPGGLLAITTGDLDSAMSRFRRERWRMIHPPTHLYYFSAATLGDAVQRCGLDVRQVTYPGYHRSLRNMVHGLATLGRAPGTERPPAPSFVPDWPIYLNFYDIMFLIAAKPGVPSL